MFQTQEKSVVAGGYLQNAVANIRLEPEKLAVQRQRFLRIIIARLTDEFS